MAAPNQLYSYREDVPQEVTQKIRIHRLQKLQIKDLEIQLNELRRNHEILDAELEPYRKAAAPVQHKRNNSSRNGVNGRDAAIQRCPNEILIVIFRMCVFTAEHHQYIATLLQVCKHWNRLIMNTPSLWARIELPGEAEWDDILHRKSLHPYISACMDRSKGIPIEVDLTFGMFPTFREWMTGVSSVALRPLMDPNDDEDILSVMDQIDWYTFKSTVYDNEVKNLFEFLTGDGGAHIQRWASLSVQICEYLIQPLMDIFAKFPPKPTTLEIFSNQVGYFTDEGLTGFGDASLVENFIIPTPTPISNFGVSPRILQRLDIYTDDTYSNLKELSQFSALRSLTLRSHGFPKDGQHSFTISLPRLHTLRIFDDHQGLNSLTWNTPVLKYLFIEVWNPMYGIPRVAAYHIELNSLASVVRRSTKSEVEEGIDSTLSLSPNIQILAVDPSFQSIAAQKIAGRQAKGELMSLYKVVGHREGQVRREAFMRDLSISPSSLGPPKV